MFSTSRFIFSVFSITMLLIFLISAAGFTENVLPPLSTPAEQTAPQSNALQLPALDQTPQRPGQEQQTFPSTNETTQNQTIGPANPFLPNLQQPGATIQPQTTQPVIQWKQLNLNETFGFDPLITGVVKYPANWLMNVDTWNKRIIFSEDQNGLIAFTALLPTQSTIENAQVYAQQIAGWLQQSIPDLKIINQDYRSDPNAAQAGMNLTSGKITLQGTYQGKIFTFLLQPYVLFVPVVKMSYTSALLCQAPQDVFQEKLQTYFNPMLVSFENNAKGMQ